MSKRKKFVIIAGFCLLLILTGTVNVLLNNYASTKANSELVVQTAGNFFMNYRTDRTDTRAQEILYLDAIISSESSSETAIANAEATKQRLITLMESELVIEGLIKAKGFEDVVVSSLNNNISVIVKGAELTENDTIKIVEIVQSQTGYDIDNIKIFPVE